MPALPILENADSRSLLAQAKALGLRALTQVDGGRIGEQKSPRRGFSVEFAQHREYVPGDDPRHLDWRAYARSERLTIKEYRQETNYTLQIVLDHTPSMAYPLAAADESEKTVSKGYQARLMALVAGLVAQGQGDQIALWLADGDTTRMDGCILPSTIRAGAGRILANTLTNLQPVPGPESPGQKSDLARVLGQVVARPVRKGLVLDISDLLEPWDPLASLLRQIRVRGHDLLVLQVLHGDEIDMPFTGDVRFNDLESGASVNTRPHQIRQHYTKLVAQWLERVRGDLQGMRADYALLRAGQEPDNGLLSLLASRQARRKATGAG